MNEASNVTTDIYSDIVRQIEKLQQTVQEASADELEDGATMGILRLLEQLLQQPSRAACELVQRSTVKAS